MDAFEVDGLEAARSAAGQLYHEFLRRDSMSAGLYVLRAREDGSADAARRRTSSTTSSPGTGRIRVDGARPPGRPGSIIFVAAGVDHRFHSITSDLTCWWCSHRPRT